MESRHHCADKSICRAGTETLTQEADLSQRRKDGVGRIERACSTLSSPAVTTSPFSCQCLYSCPAREVDIRDTGLIPESGSSPGGGHGNPLQDSCLENPMDRGALQARVHRVAKSWT